MVFRDRLWHSDLQKLWINDKANDWVPTHPSVPKKEIRKRGLPEHSKSTELPSLFWRMIAGLPELPTSNKSIGLPERSFCRCFYIQGNRLLCQQFTMVFIHPPPHFFLTAPSLCWELSLFYLFIISTSCHESFIQTNFMSSCLK